MAPSVMSVELSEQNKSLLELTGFGACGAPRCGCGHHTISRLSQSHAVTLIASKDSCEIDSQGLVPNNCPI